MALYYFEIIFHFCVSELSVSWSCIILNSSVMYIYEYFLDLASLHLTSIYDDINFCKMYEYININKNEFDLLIQLNFIV